MTARVLTAVAATIGAGYIVTGRPVLLLAALVVLCFAGIAVPTTRKPGRVEPTGVPFHQLYRNTTTTTKGTHHHASSSSTARRSARYRHPSSARRRR